MSDKLEISAEALPQQLVIGDRVFHIPTGLAVEVLEVLWTPGEPRYKCRFPKGAELTIERSKLGGVHQTPDTNGASP